VEDFRLKLFVLILTLTPVAPAKGVKYKTPADAKNKDEIVCINPSRPYIILSRRDKTRLEQIIKAKGTQNIDPNLSLK
jgi:hypothetical protein